MPTSALYRDLCVPSVPTIPSTAMMTPYWKSPDGRHLVYHADCLTILPSLTGQEILVTDPPFGVKFDRRKRHYGAVQRMRPRHYASYDDTLENFQRLIVPRVHAYLDRTRLGAVFGGPYFREYRQADSLGGVFLPASVGHTAWGSFNFSPILLYGTHPVTGRHRPTVLVSTSPSDRTRHPCSKAVEWMIWLVNLASQPNDMVVDAFCGSGSIGVACIKTGRKSVSIDIEESYCQETVERLQATLRQPYLPFDEPVQGSLWD